MYASRDGEVYCFKKSAKGFKASEVSEVGTGFGICPIREWKAYPKVQDSM